MAPQMMAHSNNVNNSIDMIATSVKNIHWNLQFTECLVGVCDSTLKRLNPSTVYFVFLVSQL